MNDESKSTGKQEQDRRKTFRCPAPPEVKDALLCVSGRDHRVTVVDESAGGYCVKVAREIRLRWSDEAVLKTQVGWYRVVVRQRREQQGQFVYGLERISEIHGKWRGGSILSALAPSGMKNQGGKFVVIGRIGWAALALSTAFVGWTMLLTSEWLQEHVSAARHASSEVAEGTGFDWSPYQDEIHDMARLASPDVAAAMDISPQQRVDIQRVVRSARTSLRTLKASADRMSQTERKEETERAISQAKSEIRRILSRRQLQKWPG